jgi:hypothetical protein
METGAVRIMTEDEKREFYAYWWQTTKTYSWYFGHEVGEVEVLPCFPLYSRPRVYEPTRAWLWQVWTTRVGVLLYSQRLEVKGQKKKRVNLHVTFFNPVDVQIVRKARGWPQPTQDVLRILQQTEAEEEEEARQIMSELWEVV